MKSNTIDLKSCYLKSKYIELFNQFMLHDKVSLPPAPTPYVHVPFKPLNSYSTLFSTAELTD